MLATGMGLAAPAATSGGYSMLRVPLLQEASNEQVVADSIAVVKSALGLTQLESVPVVHCRNAYGIVLEGTAGWKFAFSGDTRPCPQMAAAAKDATILVHEVIPISAC